MRISCLFSHSTHFSAPNEIFLLKPNFIRNSVWGVLVRKLANTPNGILVNPIKELFQVLAATPVSLPEQKNMKIAVVSELTD